MVEAATYGSYASVEETLTERGFTHVIGPGVPICRWRIGDTVADVMPTEESILGFGNRWYPDAVRTATTYTLPSGTVIRMIASQYFLATKLEAFHTRGDDDARLSYDMEDIIAVLDGRPEVEEEIAGAETSLHDFLSDCEDAEDATGIGTRIRSRLDHLGGVELELPERNEEPRVPENLD